MSGDDPTDVWPEIQQWLLVAEADQRAARLCLGADPPLCDIAAYHCQQAAEKLLKGFLVSIGTHTRKTHDLERLADLLRAQFPSILPLLASVGYWTAWGVAYRYPNVDVPEPTPSVEDLSEALVIISQLETALRALRPAGS